MASLVEER